MKIGNRIQCNKAFPTDVLKYGPKNVNYQQMAVLSADVYEADRRCVYRELKETIE